MSKLGLNDDGTITLPLRGREAITLPEPSIAQLAEMTGYAILADAALPDIPTMPEDATDVAALKAANETLRERTTKTYSTEAPYGVAVVQIVKMLTDTAITLDDLPGWAASPQCLRQIIGHWQTPLDGEG
jgi:hypothetical protein